MKTKVEAIQIELWQDWDLKHRTSKKSRALNFRGKFSSAAEPVIKLSQHSLLLI